MESFAFIGTKQPRAVPRAWYQLYTAAAEFAASNGMVVHSGATPGAEQVAAERALEAGGTVRLYLPWQGFEAGWLTGLSRVHRDRVLTVIFDPEVHLEWTEAIHAWHPNGERLARASLSIYARNFGLVREATTVIALPYVRLKNGGADKGQTAQGLDLARELGLSLFDLSEELGRQRMRAMLEMD